MNITKVKDGIVISGEGSELLPSNGRDTLHLSAQGWEALRAKAPEAVALRELVEALLAEGDEEYCAMVNRVLGHKPELASAVQEGRVLVRRISRQAGRQTPSETPSETPPPPSQSAVEDAFLDLLNALDMATVMLTPELRTSLKNAREVRGEIKRSKRERRRALEAQTRT